MDYLFDFPIHPIAVHFVIALSIFAAALDIWASFKSDAAIAQFAKLTTCFVAIAAVITIATGWFDHETWHATSQHHHDDASVIGLHMKLGIALAILFCGLAILRYRIKGLASKLYLLLILTGVTGITFQAYLGGELVYSEGIGVRATEEHRAEDKRPEDKRTEENRAEETLHNGSDHEHSHDTENHH
ncbi:DUF2231 domain-containing protein [Amphritea sp. HPY]|uniref:DUF2231 domain-containing protein n=1 Tax=Amphritea sp. HPY TaxID=3421652 RepID=UPI003D7DCA86